METLASRVTHFRDSTSFFTAIVFLFLGLSLAPCESFAQDVRQQSRFGSGGSVRRFRDAAEEQNVRTWPIKSDGKPGTAVRVTFDGHDADAVIVTDRAYGHERLLETARAVAKTIGLPQTEFVRFTDRTNSPAIDLDLEFNDAIRKRGSSLTFDLPLGEFARALNASDLPRPIVIGVEVGKPDGIVGATATDLPGERGKSGIVFVPSDSVSMTARIAFVATPHASGWVIVGFFFLAGGFAIVTPILVWRGRKKHRIAEVAKPEPPSPDDVQKAYDRSRPQWTFALAPLLMFVLFAFGNPKRAMESAPLLFPLGMPIALGLTFLGLLSMVGTMFAGRILDRRKTRNAEASPEPDPDEPPAWTQRVLLLVPIPFLALMLASSLAFALIPGADRALVSLPRPVAQSLPITLPLLFLSLMAVVGFLARRAVRTTLGPGDFWHDRVHELASRGGVAVKHVVLVRSTSPNAYASLLGTVGLTSALVRKLEPAEVDSVIAHELGHLKLGHVRRTLIVGLIFLAVWIGLVFGLEAIVRRLNGGKLPPGFAVAIGSPLLGVFVAPLLSGFFVGRGQRKREHEADAFAAKLVGGPELVARALTKIHTLAAAPHRLKPSDEAIHTHPSLVHRLDALRSVGDRKES